MTWMKTAIGYFSLLILILLYFFAAGLNNRVHAVKSVNIDVFTREGCVHCRDQQAYFEQLKQTRQDFKLTYHDLADPNSHQLWLAITQQEQIAQVTPITLIGETLIVGFDQPNTSGKRIEELIDYYLVYESRINGIQDYLDQDLRASIETNTGICEEECVVPASQQTLSYVNVPLIGVVNLRQLSLPVLAITLGFVDGFNPCAMWVLLTFLVILAQVGDRKKMIMYAGLFVVAEAIMYLLILNVWYATWDFVGLDQIISPVVGLLAIGGGIFFLYEAKTSSGSECKVTNLQQKQQIKTRIQTIINQPLTLATGIAIIFLALSVNIIEFACSIGIPQAFTKILEMNQLNFINRSYLMGLYILMYMVDDLIVFGLALYSFEKIGLTHKYTKAANYLGGVLLLILGGILIFNPNLLQLF